MDPAIQKLAIGDEEPITCRPADMLAPGWEDARQEIGDLAQSEEDVMSYALFPQIARPFLQRRKLGLGGKEELAAAIGEALYQQAVAKEARPAAAAGPAPGGSMWRMAARAGIQRGW
jgi:oxaloacetate decarboxylase alpha subunit